MFGLFVVKFSTYFFCGGISIKYIFTHQNKTQNISIFKKFPQTFMVTNRILAKKYLISRKKTKFSKTTTHLPTLVTAIHNTLIWHVSENGGGKNMRPRVEMKKHGSLTRCEQFLLDHYRFNFSVFSIDCCPWMVLSQSPVNWGGLQVRLCNIGRFPILAQGSAFRAKCFLHFQFDKQRGKSFKHVAGSALGGVV